MSTLTAATWVFALLLVVAGSAKLVRPDGLGVALRVTGGRAERLLARALGGGELGVGGLVLVLGGPLPPALLAVSYAALAMFAERRRRQGGACGCFGTTTTPATALHVWLDVTAATVATVAMIAPGASLPATVMDDPPYGVLVVLLVAVAAGVLRLLLTAVPDLTTALALMPPRHDA